MAMHLAMQMNVNIWVCRFWQLFAFTICEGVMRSAPSSEKRRTVEEAECAVGVLIDIDQTEVITEKPTEVCLVEEGGEELDLIVWEEIKEGENVWAFRIWTDVNPERSKSRGVQTEPMLRFETPVGTAAGFPNLATGGGLLPYPVFHGGKGKFYEPLEWTVTVHPRNYPGGRRVILYALDPSFRRNLWREIGRGTLVAEQSVPYGVPPFVP